MRFSDPFPLDDNKDKKKNEIISIPRLTWLRLLQQIHFLFISRSPKTSRKLSYWKLNATTPPLLTDDDNDDALDTRQKTMRAFLLSSHFDLHWMVVLSETKDEDGTAPISGYQLGKSPECSINQVDAVAVVSQCLVQFTWGGEADAVDGPEKSEIMQINNDSDITTWKERHWLRLINSEIKIGLKLIGLDFIMQISFRAQYISMNNLYLRRGMILI